MRTPSERDESICAMFDSLCVTVIRNYSRNLKRSAENRKKHDATGDEAVEYLIKLLSHEDVYEAEQLVLNADGYCLEELEKKVQKHNNIVLEWYNKNTLDLQGGIW